MCSCSRETACPIDTFVDFSYVSDTELGAASQAVEDSYICCWSQGVFGADDHRALVQVG